MFLRKKKLSIIVCVLLISAWITKTTYVTRSDIETVRAFGYSAKETSHKSPLKPLASQRRQSIIKEFWKTNDSNERLQTRITSAASEIAISSNGKKMDVEEEMHSVKCWIQEKIDRGSTPSESTQKVRFFTADTGKYQYRSHLFKSDKVNLSILELSGETLPEVTDEMNLEELSANAPIATVVAEKVTLDLHEKTPAFYAKKVRAKGDRKKTSQ